MQRIRFILNERGGLIGLYRGLGPGTCRSFLANGSAMVVMQYAQRKVTEWGLRDWDVCSLFFLLLLPKKYYISSYGGDVWVKFNIKWKKGKKPLNIC